MTIKIDMTGQDGNKQAEEAAQQAEASAEVAAEAATEATAAVEEVKEAVEEVKADPSTNAQDKGEPKKEVKPVSASLEKIIEQIEKLQVIELADLVHALEDRFGVTAQAPMAVAPSAGSGQAAAGEPEAEQTSFNVILAASGANKIGVIKAVRELVPTLGLKEAKDLVEAAPKPVMEGVNKATSEEAKAKLTAAGATVELQ